MKVFNAPNDDMRVKTDSRLRGPDSRFRGNDMGGRYTRVPRIAQRFCVESLSTSRTNPIDKVNDVSIPPLIPY